MRELHGRCSIFAGHDGARSHTNGMEKRLQLQFERLCIAGLSLFHCHRPFAISGNRSAPDDSLPRLKINCDTPIGLEYSPLTHGLGGDPTGGQLCNTAFLKLDARIGDIMGRRKQKSTGSPDRLDRARVAGKQEINVMNHEIKHDVDIGTPFTIRAQSMTFEQHRSVNMRSHERHDGIEPLTVPHLQCTFVTTGQSDKIPRLTRRHRDRLFYKNMFFCFEAGLCNSIMTGGRHGNTDDLNLFQKLRQTTEWLCPELLSDGGSPCAILIHDTNQRRIR